MARPYKFVHVDPERLPESSGPPYIGTNAECLRDGLLDVIEIAVRSGMTLDDVDAAVAGVIEHVARMNRSRIRLCAAKDSKVAK